MILVCALSGEGGEVCNFGREKARMRKYPKCGEVFDELETELLHEEVAVEVILCCVLSHVYVLGVYSYARI